MSHSDDDDNAASPTESEDPEREARRRRERLETFRRVTDELREGLVRRFRLGQDRQLPQYAWRLITQRRSREERRMLLDSIYEEHASSEEDDDKDAEVHTLDQIYAQEMAKVTARSLASYRVSFGRSL